MYEKTVKEIDRAIALLEQEFKKAREQIQRLERSRDQVKSSLRSLARAQKRGARIAHKTGQVKIRLGAAPQAPRRPGKPGRPVKIKGVSQGRSEQMVSAWKAYRQRKQEQQGR